MSDGSEIVRTRKGRRVRAEGGVVRDIRGIPFGKGSTVVEAIIGGILRVVVVEAIDPDTQTLRVMHDGQTYARFAEDLAVVVEVGDGK